MTLRLAGTADNPSAEDVDVTVKNAFAFHFKLGVLFGTTSLLDLLLNFIPEYLIVSIGARVWQWLLRRPVSASQP